MENKPKRPEGPKFNEVERRALMSLVSTSGFEGFNKYIVRQMKEGINRMVQEVDDARLREVQLRVRTLSSLLDEIENAKSEGK